MGSDCKATLTIGGVSHSCHGKKHHKNGTMPHYSASPRFGYVVSWHDPSPSDPDHDGDVDNAPSGSGDNDGDASSHV